MKIGCSSLLYGGFDLTAAVDGLKTAGFEAIELCSMPGFGEHFRGGEEAASYAAIHTQLDEAGLYLESVGCGSALGTDRFAPLLDAAAALGAPCMTLVSGGVAGNEDSWNQVLETVRAALPLAEEAGVKLSFMPHVRAAVCNTATSLRFIEQLASPFVGLNIDNTHLERSGDDPLAAVEALKPYLLTARIRDYKSDDFGVGLVENQIPGRGTSDVRGYYQALTTVPGLECVVLEMVGTNLAGAALTSFELRDVQRIAGEALVALRSYQQ